MRIGLALLGVAVLVGYSIRTPTEAGIYERMLREMPAGQAIPVATLLDRKFDRVCQLYPYGVDIPDTEPDAEVLNSFLKKIGYEADEDTWSLVWLHDGQPSLTAFDRESEMDVMSGSEIQPLPASLKQVTCARSEAAHILSIRTDRDYFVLVEKIE